MLLETWHPLEALLCCLLLSIESADLGFALLLAAYCLAICCLLNKERLHGRYHLVLCLPYVPLQTKTAGLLPLPFASISKSQLDPVHGPDSAFFGETLGIAPPLPPENPFYPVHL